MFVVLHRAGMAQAASDQPAVDGKRGDPRNRQGQRQAAPEQRACDPGVHGAGYGKQHGVVDNFHHGNGQGICREGDADRRTHRMLQIVAPQDPVGLLAREAIDPVAVAVDVPALDDVGYATHDPRGAVLGTQ